MECDLQCLNGGTPELDTCARCSCPSGYTGDFCEEDIDECSIGNPCTGGGECRNTVGGYLCSCDIGLTGKNCNIDINECLLENPCMNSGSCFNEPFGSFHCVCTESWTGPTCQECAVENCRRCEVGSVPARCEQEQCEEGYQLDEDGMCSCSIENCESCSGTPAVCTMCNPGYQLDSNSLACECALEYCDVCEGNPAECRMCSRGYVLTSGHQCVCPVANCAQCGGTSPSSVCEQCKEGYELSSGGQCRCMIDNCISCQGSLPTCQACDDGFVLSEGVCVRATPPSLCTVDNCESCQNGTSQCLQCRDGYEVNTVLNYCDFVKQKALTDPEIAGIIIGGIIGVVVAVFVCTVAVSILWSRGKSQPPSEEDGIHRKDVQNPIYLVQTPAGNIAYRFVMVDAGYSSSLSYSGEFESDLVDDD